MMPEELSSHYAISAASHLDGLRRSVDEVGCIQPMSSPKMKTILGLLTGALPPLELRSTPQGLQNGNSKRGLGPGCADKPKKNPRQFPAGGSPRVSSDDRDQKLR